MTKKEREELGKEIVDSIDKPHGRIRLPMRFGKTKVAIDLIKKFKPKSILWVTPDSDLATREIPLEFEKWRAKTYLKRLTTVTWRSLDTLVEHFDLIILDEEQTITPNNSRGLFDGSLTYNNILTLTGTPSKDVHKENLIQQLQLPILIEITLTDAVDLGVLSNYQVNVLLVPMDVEDNLWAGSKDRKFKTSEAKQYNYWSSRYERARLEGKSTTRIAILRMNTIHNSPSKLRAAKFLKKVLKGRRLFFCASQKQAEEISNQVYHGNTTGKYLQKFLKKETDLLTLVNKGGVGVTYTEVDHLVLTQVDSDVSGRTTQKIGRTLLAQGDYEATIWLLVSQGTQDEVWARSVLSRFHQDKIKYYDFNYLKEAYENKYGGIEYTEA